jgi:hypothetical protein
MARGMRTVHLALQELRTRDIIDTQRTGRSSWYSVVFQADQMTLFDDHDVAHQQSILLRILRSISLNSLSSTLARLGRRRKGAQEALVRNCLVEPEPRERQFNYRRLVNAGVEPVQARILANSYTTMEINDVLCTTSATSSSGVRVVRNLTFGWY